MVEDLGAFFVLFLEPQRDSQKMCEKKRVVVDMICSLHSIELDMIWDVANPDNEMYEGC